MATISHSKEARRFFLEKIENRLAAEGRPVSGLALEYWKSLEPEDERALGLLWADSAAKGRLPIIEKEFEAALCEAIQADLNSDPARKAVYLRLLTEIASEKGVQLQAIVFAATASIRELATGGSKWAYILTAVVLLIGWWLGTHLHR